MTLDEEQRLLLIAKQVTTATLRRYPRLTYQRDEILSDATLGIAKALSRYHPELKVPLGAYARLRAQGEVMDGIRSRSPVGISQHRRGTLVEDLIPAQRPPVPLELLDDIPATGSGYDVINDRLLLYTAIQRLSPRRRQVVVEYYLRDRTMLDIATRLGITEPAVSLRIKDALRALRSILAA